MRGQTRSNKPYLSQNASRENYILFWNMARSTYASGSRSTPSGRQARQSQSSARHGSRRRRDEEEDEDDEVPDEEENAEGGGDNVSATYFLHHAVLP